MSLQLRLFGGGGDIAKSGGDSLNDGGHNINKSVALAATSADAISPMNPGNFAKNAIARFRSSRLPAISLKKSGTQ